MINHNLFAVLQAGYPQNLDACAVETVEVDGRTGLRYSWRDIDCASAMLANLLASLALPPGSGIAVQLDKSVEALMLCLGTLRAGHVFLPLNTAVQPAEIAHFVGDAAPAVVVCSKRNFGWMSKLAFVAGTRHVFTLDDDRSGSLLERAAFCSDRQTPALRAADELAVVIYTSGTAGLSSGATLNHGNMLSNAQALRDHWDWRPEGALIHAPLSGV